MARMIPSFIHPEVRSAAERKVFNAIKSSTSDDYFCLHSLGLSRHLWKRQGEIDFVLIGRNAVLCLEVKGGRIARKEGVWCFTNRFGQETRKAESPFAQVSSAMFSLKAAIESEFGHTGLLFGYGVLMPDVRFDISSPEWDNDTVYDLRDVPRPFETYTQRLLAHWERKAGRSALFADTDSVVGFLRGDFEVPTPLWQQIQDVDSQVARFTEEQFRAIDHMESNPRVIFAGGAGTGKTLLAVEKTRRAALGGLRVLLLCYNKLLGAMLRTATSGMGVAASSVHADSIHRYFAKTISGAGLQGALDRASASSPAKEVYDRIFAELFVKAARISGAQKFDLLVLDEGQDLLNEVFLNALGEILEDGITHGRWTTFLDPSAQARLFDRMSLETYTNLRRAGVPEYRLDINCRNTVEIATQTSIVSGFPTGAAKACGPKVEYILYDNDEDEARRIVQLLRTLVEHEEVPAERITVLSTRAYRSMPLFSSGVRLPNFLLELDETNISNPPQGRSGVATAQSYKGLENNIIIYCDVTRLDDQWMEAVHYTAMTRARNKLYVFLHAKARKEFETRMINYAGHDTRNRE